MASVSTFLKDMSECIDARLLGASASFGSYALGLGALACVPSPSSGLGNAVYSTLPLAALVGLALCFAASRRDASFPRRRWLWAASATLALCALALFLTDDARAETAVSCIAWAALPFCLAALVRRFGALPLRRRIAISAASAICALGGLFVLALFAAPIAFAVMAALPLAATACLPEPSELPSCEEAERPDAADPQASLVRFTPSFLVTAFTYSVLASLAVGIEMPGGGALDLSTRAAALSIAGIVLLSLHKGRKGFVEDSNSAYKPVPPLMALGLVLIAWTPEPFAPWGSALVAAGFSVFFVYYWIIIGNHIQKFSWNAAQAAAWACAPLFAGLAAGRLLSGGIFAVTESPLQTTAVLGLFLLTLALWAVTKGDLFANEPGDAANVFKFEPPTSAALAHEDETALAAFAQRYGISKREQDVVRLLSKGRNVPFICDELFIAKSTVQTHIKHIYAKTGTTNRQELLDVIEAAKQPRGSCDLRMLAPADQARGSERACITANHAALYASAALWSAWPK